MKNQSRSVFSFLKSFPLSWSSVLFILFSVLCLSSFLSPALALALGLIFALTLGNPFPSFTKKATKWLLQISVVSLGFGMNLETVLKTGKEGFFLTLAGIGGTLILGILMGRWMKIEKNTSLLITSGTAICGGSAIAAAGSVLDADERAMSVSLATIFVLNAAALFIFPSVGHWLGMDQKNFGLWSAIAIHDTSSVVGAAARYGEEALNIATTVKLTRALWIIPLSLMLALIYRKKESRFSFPWFILFFVAAAGVTTLLPQWNGFYSVTRSAGKIGLTLTLFFIGSGLSREAIRAVGIRPMLQGMILWVIVSFSSFFMIGLLT